MAQPYFNPETAPERDRLNQLVSVSCGLHTCDLTLFTKIQQEPHWAFTPEIVSLSYCADIMPKAFSFQLSPEATADENLLEKKSILNLILAAVLRTSVQYTPHTKPRLTRQDIKKLVASGLPDSVVLNAIEISDIEF